MIKIGVSLVDASGAELQNWPSLPDVISHKGEDRTGAIVGSEFSGGAMLVERFSEPDPYGSPEVLSEQAKFDGEKVIIERVYAEVDLAPLKAALIEGVKVKAGALITAYCPQYKQANLTAQAAEMALTYPGTAGDDLPEPYRSAWVTGRAIWENIKSVRAHSDVLEAEINKLATASEVQNWRAHDWPSL